MAVKKYTQEELNKATDELKQKLQAVMAENAEAVAKVEVLTAENAEAVAKVEVLTAENAEAVAKVAEVTAENETLVNDNKGLKKVIDALKKIAPASSVTVNDTAEKAKPGIPAETVKFEGKEYKFTCPTFRLPGQDEANTAEQALTDEKMIAEILAIEGQGILKEIL